MNLEEAIAWCTNENLVSIIFTTSGEKSVVAAAKRDSKSGKAFTVTSDTFLGAVKALKAAIEKG